MNNRKIVHYKDNNTSSKIMEFGFLFCELTGHTLISMCDLIVTLPEIFNRQMRRRNGIFYRIASQFQSIRSSLQIKPSSSSTHYTISVVDNTTQQNQLATTTSSSPSSYNKVDLPTTTSVLLNKSENTSPSILNTPTNTTDSQQPNQKVANLESELSRLREEIARIMASNNSTSVPSAPVIKAGGPPPPPPPAPPVYKPTNLTIKKLKTNGDASSAPSTPTKQQQPVSIGDILRSGQKITLKKSDVVRSPGGTPIRDVTNTSQQPISTQDFIAIALKKKFSSMKMDDSPEVKKRGQRPSHLKKSNNDSFFSSDSENEFDFDDDKENITSFIH